MVVYIEIKVIRGIPIDPNDPNSGTYGTTNRPGLARKHLFKET